MSVDTLPPQIVMVGDSARTRLSDPETSHEAADSNDLWQSHEDVLDQLRIAGPLTQQELVELLEFRGVKISDSRARSAVSELVKAGSVVWTGEFRKTRSGRRARLWAVAS